MVRDLALLHVFSPILSPRAFKVSLPTPSGATTSIPPIVEATGRTAPVITSGVKELVATALESGTSKSNGSASAPVGCGKIDCCKLGGNPEKPDKVLKSQFPRFTFKPYQPGTELIFPPGLRNHENKFLAFGNEERTWLRPTSLDMLLEIKSKYPEAKVSLFLSIRARLILSLTSFRSYFRLSEDQQNYKLKLNLNRLNSHYQFTLEILKNSTQYHYRPRLNLF